MPISEKEFWEAKKGDGFLAFGGRVRKVKFPLKSSFLAIAFEDGKEIRRLYWFEGKICGEDFRPIPELNHPDAEFLPQCRWV